MGSLVSVRGGGTRLCVGGLKPMDHEELGAWLRLTLSPGVGNGTARRLLSRFGLPQAIFQQPEAALQQCATNAQARALCEIPAAWQALWDTTAQWLSGA
eukprot:gene61133-81500_t